MGERKLNMIDWTKPIQTRDGLKARYLGTVIDGSDFPHVVAVASESRPGLENWAFASDSGVVTGISSVYDIFNGPLIEERWLNVYGVGSKSVARQWPSREEALDNGNGGVQGCVKVTYHDGVVVGCEFVKAA